MDNRRLVIAGDHHACAAVGLEIFRHCSDGRQDRLPSTERREQSAREALHLRCAHWDAVIGDRAAPRREGLDRVEPVDGCRLALTHAAPRREIVRVTKVSGAAVHEIGIERHDDVCFVEVVNRIHVRAERSTQTLANVVAAYRLPLMPLHAGKLGEQLLNLCAERGGCDRLGQQAQAGRIFHDRLQRGDECAPRRNLPLIPHYL